ncbi:MAG: VWA domain-containing protein [Spirochaetales bacterium]
MHICRYYHDETLPAELRTTLEDGLYRRLYAPRREEPASGDPPNEEEPIERTLSRLLGVVDFTEYTAGNSRLAERLAHEAVHWVGHRWEEISAQPELETERAVLDSVAADPDPSYEQITRAAGELRRVRPELAPTAEAVTAATDSQAAFSADRAAPPESVRTRRERLDRRARMALLRRRWQGSIERDRQRHEERELGKAIGAFVREMQQVVPRLAEEQQLVRDALGNEDALWDLGRHEWEELPLSGLTEATEMLAEHPELERLAEMIGRSESVTEKRTVRRIERRLRTRHVGIGKSEITGVQTGDDLSSLLPSEIALLADAGGEDLFFSKLAKKELLVLAYERERLVTDTRERMVSALEDVVVNRGPVIVCVDTSGSMLGLPEKVAKATTLALARRLERDRRRIEVIAFATDVRSFTLDFTERGLPELSRFLAGGFHGGTDLTKALSTSLTLLEEEAWKHADVLVISDFKVPKIADRHSMRIKRQHRRGTKFHSLTIARSEIIDPLNMFDSTWLFSTSSGRVSSEAFTRLPQT